MTGLEWVPPLAVFAVILGTVLVAAYLDWLHERNARRRREGNS